MVLSRRTVLQSTVGVGAFLGAQAIFGSSAEAASKPTSILDRIGSVRLDVVTKKLSPNGWPINTLSDAGGAVWSRPVSGAGFPVEVVIGDVETILIHVVRRFHYEIDSLLPGQVVGFMKADGLTRQKLNHSSGTAIDIRPGFYPVGAAGGFFPNELAVIRDILVDCDGLVRWGGDFKVPDEAHFEIDAAPADHRIAATASKIRLWNDTAGLGAGVIMDPADSHRRAAARSLERRQNA